MTHISGSEELKKISDSVNIKALPEMVFGQNKLQLDHTSSGVSIFFSAPSALAKCERKSTIKVRMAGKWVKKMESLGLKDSAMPFDWTYSTTYKGDVCRIESDKKQVSPISIQTDPKVKNGGGGTATGGSKQAPKEVELKDGTGHKIDMEMLMRPDKMEWFKDMTLYEDELGDNGLAKLDLKIRVMPKCFLVRMRFFLRVDGVLARVRDTRYFHDFSKKIVLREYEERESSIDDLKKRRVGKDIIFGNIELLARALTLKDKSLVVIDLS
eukprot:CAMPEP_0184484452 /NCGR_PEP_ID=MMETSP0113_2-20130426/6172_1 /TAXON_ID=91329 /ORGANISM="Norrisiella sphaerica, Strain BC52" /LENGTH=268 /DNA_ID=CAMNT_0026865453 /DNA_START=327 /DNA_END=1133 /DNA_ORIENTATION=+